MSSHSLGDRILREQPIRLGGEGCEYCRKVLDELQEKQLEAILKAVRRARQEEEAHYEWMWDDVQKKSAKVQRIRW